MAKKSKKTTWIVIGSIAALLIIAVLLGVASSGDKPVEVTVSKVGRRTITQTVSAVGKIEAETEIKVSSETSGEIVYLGVKEGDTVRRGELLVRIKPDIIQTQLEQFSALMESAKMEIDARRAEMDRSQSELGRVQSLNSQQFASAQDLDRARSAFNAAEANYKASLSRYQQAQAQYREIRRAAERTTISAPISGIVTSLAVEQGEKVVGTAQMQGTEMLRVSDLNVMNAVVDVSEDDIIHVKNGDTANIEIDALPDKVYKGVVIEIGHAAKQSALGTQDQVTNFAVKVRIIDKEFRLRPGMSCNVDILTETKYNVLAAPLMAVTVRDVPKNEDEGGPVKNLTQEKLERANKNKPQSVVFAPSGDKAKLVKVETGVSDNGYIEITSGLREGQEIISGSFQAVSKTLNDGSKISRSAKKKYGKKQV